MHQWALFPEFVGSGNHARNKRTLAVAGIDHASTLEFMEGFPNDRAGHSQPRCQLTFGRYLLLRSEPTVKDKAFKPV